MKRTSGQKKITKASLEEGRDYHILPNGLLVMSALYLLERGYCCGNGCMNCPYDYIKVPEPKRTLLLQKRADEASRNNGQQLHHEQGEQ